MSTCCLVLVVDDNLIIQGVVEDALTDAGYAVVVASTGLEAFETIDVPGANIAALVTDVDLSPGTLTGWDVARHAREITPELPVVYMTGASGRDWLANGVSDSVLLSKPFAAAQVVTAVLRLLA